MYVEERKEVLVDCGPGAQMLWHFHIKTVSLPGSTDESVEGTAVKRVPIHL